MNDDGTVATQSGAVASNATQHMVSVLLPGILCNDTSIIIEDPKFASPPSSPANSMKTPELINNVDDESKDLEGQHFSAKAGMPPYSIQGDPTESCIITLLAKLINPLEARKLKKSFPRLEEVPFDSAVKYMSTMHSFYVDELEKYLNLNLTNHPLVRGKLL